MTTSQSNWFTGLEARIVITAAFAVLINAAWGVLIGLSAVISFFAIDLVLFRTVAKEDGEISRSHARVFAIICGFLTPVLLNIAINPSSFSCDYLEKCELITVQTEE